MHVESYQERRTKSKYYGRVKVLSESASLADR